MFKYRHMAFKTRLIVAFFNSLLLAYLFFYRDYPLSIAVFLFSPLYIIISILGYEVEKYLKKDKDSSN